LPARFSHSEQDSLLAKDSFKAMVDMHQQCESGVDAEITVTLNSKFYTGTMNGYLQAMAPASVKLVAINPLGQPLLVVVSDGEHFHYVSFVESIHYDGSVDSETFRRFVPSGFELGSSFYSLTGKLFPGEIRILSTSNDQAGRGVWLELDHIKESTHSLVLFDQKRQLILQYLRLMENGEVSLKIDYGDFSPGSCSLPGLLTISSIDHSGELVIRLKDWHADSSFTPADFELQLPPGFERVKLN